MPLRRSDPRKPEWITAYRPEARMQSWRLSTGRRVSHPDVLKSARIDTCAT